MRSTSLAALVAVVAGIAVAGCGSESVDVPSSSSASVERGAQLFAERCAGCHTFDRAGAQGGADKPSDKEKVDGPNFNVRRESVDEVLYAIRNGGFSGAIMPENIVVGADARAVAEFVSEYAGK